MDEQQKPVDCIGGQWSRQGRVKKDSPDHSAYAEFIRDVILSGKQAPIHTVVRVSGMDFVMLGSRASRGARGSTAIILLPLKNGAPSGTQRYFIDWSADNGGLTVEGFSFPSFSEWAKIRAEIAALNLSPIPSGTGSNKEWEAACKRREFAPLVEFDGFSAE